MVSGYTAADAASDLEWVERRIGEMVAGNWGAETIAKYQACADELRAIVAGADRKRSAAT